MNSHWKVKDRGIDLSMPVIMGILNVTPDSFSDGGKYLDLDQAYEKAQTMLREGASIIDVGGESTRPGSEEVSLQEELDRVIPVIEKLSHNPEMLISIDTRKAEVAEKAVQAGAHIINDVEANRTEPSMWKIVGSSGAGYIAMHMKGKPKTMQQSPEYDNAVTEVFQFFEKLIPQIESHGVNRKQIVIDVGIGFGKTLEHNLDLLGHLETFSSLFCPQLIGVSRKSLFGKLLGLEVHERLVPSITSILWAYSKGVKLFRVHDVKETQLALQTWDAFQNNSQ